MERTEQNCSVTGAPDTEARQPDRTYFTFFGPTSNTPYHVHRQALINGFKYWRQHQDPREYGSLEAEMLAFLRDVYANKFAADEMEALIGTFRQAASEAPLSNSELLRISAQNVAFQYRNSASADRLRLAIVEMEAVLERIGGALI